MFALWSPESTPQSSLGAQELAWSEYHQVPLRSGLALAGKIEGGSSFTALIRGGGCWSVVASCGLVSRFGAHCRCRFNLRLAFLTAMAKVHSRNELYCILVRQAYHCLTDQQTSSFRMRVRSLSSVSFAFIRGLASQWQPWILFLFCPGSPKCGVFASLFRRSHGLSGRARRLELGGPARPLFAWCQLGEAFLWWHEVRSA